MTEAEYQERAEHCRKMAAAATTDELKASWLFTAEMWLQMATAKQRRSPEAQFHTITDAQGTGQKSSDASH